MMSHPPTRRTARIFTSLLFDAFDPVTSVISLPPDSVFLRGCDMQYPPVSDRPAFFTSSESTAMGYAESHGQRGRICSFKTTRMIHLLDVRMVRSVLRMMFEQLTVPPDEKSRQTIQTTTLAFGLCSLSAQIELVRHVYSSQLQERTGYADQLRDAVRALEEHRDTHGGGAHPVEVPGVRIAETNNDAFAMMCASNILGVDGYIAPQLFSPFHTTQGFRTPSEILLFRPSSCIMRYNVQRDDRVMFYEIKGEPPQLGRFSSRDHSVPASVWMGSLMAIRRATPPSAALPALRATAMGGAARGASGAVPEARPVRRRPTPLFDPCAFDKMSERRFRALERKAHRATRGLPRFTAGVLKSTPARGASGGGGAQLQLQLSATAGGGTQSPFTRWTNFDAIPDEEWERVKREVRAAFPDGPPSLFGK
jgi:hypothetical protein